MTSDRAGRESRLRAELAAFLRARRDELQPEDVGIGRKGRRRVEGLRRHEVADLASVSVTLYTWLEQGRVVGVSPQALDAVSRALQLDDDGARYVRRLAGAPVDVTPGGRPEVAPALVALVDDLSPSPAYLTTGCFDLIAWNPAFSAVFGDPDAVPVEQRNGLYLLFDPELATRLESWEEELEDNVARFRSASGKYPDDPRFAEILADLLETEPRFAAAWEKREAKRFYGRAQVVNHPDAGELRLDMVELTAVEHSGVTLVVHRPADDETRRRLDALILSHSKI